MFIRYTANAGISQANLRADLVALITGSVSDVNQLSAGCNKEFSEIIGNCTDWVSMPNAGNDVVTGGSQLCFRALNEDGLSYKFAVLSITTNSCIYIGSCVNFNNGNYVNRSKDNYRNLGNTNSQPFRLLITVNKNMVVFQYENNQGNLNFPVGVIEFTRDDKWNTPASGNAAHVIMNGQYIGANRANNQEESQWAFTIPKAQGGNPLNYFLITSFGAETPNTFNGDVTNYNYHSRGADGVTPEVVVSDGRIMGKYATSCNLGGKLLGGIKFCNNNAGIQGDELILDGKHYTFNNCNGASSSYRYGILLPKE